MSWRDILDILLVTLFFYALWSLLKDTRAANLVRGVLVFLLVWFLARLLGLNTLAWLLGNAATLGAFSLVVVFQPELRGLLERLGRGQVRQERWPYLELIRAVRRLAERGHGALIALERRTPLGDFATLEAPGNPFFPWNPPARRRRYPTGRENPRGKVCLPPL